MLLKRGSPGIAPVGPDPIDLVRGGIDIRDLFDRFLVVVDQIDDFAVLWRQATVAKDWRSNSSRFFFSSTISGLSAGSTIVEAV
jgi:hypothetical protein